MFRFYTVRDIRMAHKKFTATDDNGMDMSAELANFANFIGLDTAAPNRYSILLVLGLFGGYKSGHLNPAKIIHEIKALEGIGTSSQLKPASLFKHPPLKGLWHKHYLEDGLRPFAINIQKGLKKYGIPFVEQRIREAQIAGVRLAKSEALTGEWIVYAQHEGKNYYLCLGKHDSGDDELRKQIEVVCCQEFTFLTTLLA